jgi:hypothetical protein
MGVISAWQRLATASLALHMLLVFPAQSDEATAGPAASLNSDHASSITRHEAIAWSEIGVKATADYHGEGLVVLAETNGARLRCVFQKLEGEVTSHGLWLRSTTEESEGEGFRVMATTVERSASECGKSLSRVGAVSIHGPIARFTRPVLIEEYSVTMDGVRQDFVIEQKPSGEGDLRVELAVTGAKVESTAYGAELVLEKSGRKIAYSRLRVTDATGSELPARLQVQKSSALSSPHSAFDLAVLVNDTHAVYPVRIDPTFSDANWISMGSFPGTDGDVYAAVADGSGTVYIGGHFSVVGNALATNIAKWNGTNWSALGSGVGGGNKFNPPAVFALAVSGNDVFAGGSFTTAGESLASHIAKWNGSSWSALGAGVSGNVYALAISGIDLYAGGNFTTAGGIMATNIARWNGVIWSALGSGMGGGFYPSSPPIVNALAISGTDLYAGGGFTTAGGHAANRIARWDGISWSALGSGLNSNVLSLAFSGSDLYVGGVFTTAGGNPANYIARWNGSSWSALGSGMAGGSFPYVNALAISGSDLYAGGYFTTAGGMSVNYVAKWNGSSWSALGSGIGSSFSSVRALAVSGGDLYVGGQFTTAGGKRADYIAKWNGADWSALGVMGIDNIVHALAVSGSDLYVGGGFTSAGGITASNIAKWNGNSWLALGSGLNGPVLGLAISGSDLYAAGFFTTAGGSPANRVAKWDGSSWSPLGSGMSEYYVEALAVSGSDLYAGGFFTTAGGRTVNNIAKWNGNSWSALDSGMNDVVLTLAVSGGDLYAGGAFTRAGEFTMVRYIAKWNGSNWSTLGSGMNNNVAALAVSGTSLYAGGYFTTAGGAQVDYIAKWNGSSWSAVGSGMNSPVSALAASGTDLYAGGLFTMAGGSPANYIAKWNGSNWSALGSGMNGLNGAVESLAVSGGQLYAGGYFIVAGGKISTYVARAYLERPSLSIVRNGGNVSLSWPTFYDTFVLQQNSNVTNRDGWSNANYPFTTSATIKRATVPQTSSNQFFRLIEN